MTGEYGGCGKILYPKSVSFCKVNLTTCGHVIMEQNWNQLIHQGRPLFLQGSMHLDPSSYAL